MKKSNILKVNNMAYIIYKIAMFIIRYSKVVSRLPECMQQNINAQAPLSFTCRLDITITKDKSIKLCHYQPILGQAHFTKNDSHALKEVL